MRPACLCIITAVLLFTACSKSNKDNNQGPDSLLGNWNFLGYGGGFAGGWHPATTSTIVTFRADSTYQTVTGRTVTGTSPFHTSHIQIPPGTETYAAILLGEGVPLMGYAVKNDTLHIYDFANDGFDYLYGRLP